MTALIVHKATGWLPDGRRVTAEDWPTAEAAQEALHQTKLFVRLVGHGIPTEEDQDWLADTIVSKLGIDPATVFGCSIIVGE